MLRISILLLVLAFTSCTAQKKEKTKTKSVTITNPTTLEGLQTAYFAEGCFWCAEAVFEDIEGVAEVISGFAGGGMDDATYKAVSSGSTDHAETIEVYYDSTKIDYPTLLKVFFGSHDPTTLNRQGPDSGRQYRSAIFYKNTHELAAAKKYIQQLENEKTFTDKIVTTLESFDRFYPAEDYHQNYVRLNPNQPYVRGESIPRYKRSVKNFPELLKKNKK